MAGQGLRDLDRAGLAGLAEHVQDNVIRAGSLTTSSHGCVHLSLPSARYYHDHLPEEAEVAVF